MYVIIVYDSDNSNKFRKLLKKYLIWEQNSVFKGEITKFKFLKLRSEIENISESKDSVTIFTTEHEFINIYNIGIKKSYDDNFI